MNQTETPQPSDAQAATLMTEQCDALLETIVEHLQSAWIATGHYTAHDRYQRVWSMGTTEYHLQAAERAARDLCHVMYAAALLAKEDQP